MSNLENDIIQTTIQQMIERSIKADQFKQQVDRQLDNVKWTTVEVLNVIENHYGKRDADKVRYALACAIVKNSEGYKQYTKLKELYEQYE